MGVQANPRISEEKGLFPPFSGFSRCSSAPPEKGKKGRKRAKKADFGRFPGRAARHLLSPHLLHPHLRQPNKCHRRQPTFRHVRDKTCTATLQYERAMEELQAIDNVKLQIQV